MPYINERWLGGMLTNFETISKRVAKMQEYQRMRDSGEFEAMPKKEALLIGRELEKLERNLGGIRHMERLPDAVFILDTKKEHIAVTEANKLGIPIVAVVDTNCDPDVIQYVIPGNDDAIRSGTLMCRVIADAVEEGRFIASARGAAAAAAGRRAHAPRRRPRIAAQQAEARRQAAAAAAEREARIAAGEGRGRRRRAAAPPRPPRRADAEAAAEAAAPTEAAVAEAADAEAAPPRPPTAEPRRRARRPTTEETSPMAEFTAKDVQALRQATGAGMMDAKKALAGERRRHRGRRQVAAREGPGQGGRARDRENTQGAVAVVVDGNVARHRRAQVRDRLRRPSPTTSPRSSRSSPTLVAAEGEDARRRRAKDRSTTSRSRSRRTSRSAGSCASRPPRATSSTPTSTARTAAA